MADEEPELTFEAIEDIVKQCLIKVRGERKGWGGGRGRRHYERVSKEGRSDGLEHSHRDWDERGIGMVSLFAPSSFFLQSCLGRRGGLGVHRSNGSSLLYGSALLLSSTLRTRRGAQVGGARSREF